MQCSTQLNSYANNTRHKLYLLVCG